MFQSMCPGLDRIIAKPYSLAHIITIPLQRNCILCILIKEIINNNPTTERISQMIHYALICAVSLHKNLFRFVHGTHVHTLDGFCRSSHGISTCKHCHDLTYYQSELRSNNPHSPQWQSVDSSFWRSSC